MRKLFLFGFVLFVTLPAHAQVKPTDNLMWVQDESSLAIAQGFRYELELDNVVLVEPLKVTCSGIVRPWNCQAPIPAVTPTTHTIRIRPIDITNADPIVGPWSDIFTFTMRAVPSKPTGIKIIPGGL